MPRNSGFIFHSLFLVAAVLLAYFWTSQPELSYYTLQLIALFVLFFFLNQFVSRRQRQKINLTFDAVIFTMVVLLLVTSTGGLTSPLFFITVTLTMAMIIFFLLTPSKEEPLAEIFQLFSLLLITPLALFFGKQYLKMLADEEKIKILKTEEAILESEIEKEETDTLLWASLELKKDLGEILERACNLLADVGHLTLNQKENLEKIRERTENLLKTGQRLKEEVDQTTDEE
jgi:hypothetical protein